MSPRGVSRCVGDQQFEGEQVEDTELSAEPTAMEVKPDWPWPRDLLHCTGSILAATWLWMLLQDSVEGKVMALTLLGPFRLRESQASSRCVASLLLSI